MFFVQHQVWLQRKNEGHKAYLVVVQGGPWVLDNNKSWRDKAIHVKIGWRWGCWGQIIGPRVPCQWKQQIIDLRTTVPSSHGQAHEGHGFCWPTSYSSYNYKQRLRYDKSKGLHLPGLLHCVTCMCTWVTMWMLSMSKIVVEPTSVQWHPWLISLISIPITSKSDNDEVCFIACEINDVCTFT